MSQEDRPYGAQDKLAGEGAGHWQKRVKCMACGLHFVILTWEPERHTPASIHCPECGQHGEGSRYLVYAIAQPDPIFMWVPGAADMETVSLG